VQRLKRDGYRVHLLYLYVSDPEISVHRVAQRVVLGGHGVPENVIRRRYSRSLRNFFTHYRLAVTDWRLYGNSTYNPVLVASSSPQLFA
jgi:predicted ABC-type ATPase